MNNLYGLFEVIFVYLRFFDALGPHEHGAHELNIQMCQQCSPIDDVSEYLQVVDDSTQDPWEDDTAEIVARYFTHATDIDEILCH